MEHSFTKTRNITYNRFVFFSSKQPKRESVERFFRRLIEKAEHCSSEDKETTLVGDAFILNMRDHDTHRELSEGIGKQSP